MFVCQVNSCLFIMILAFDLLSLHILTHIRIIRRLAVTAQTCSSIQFSFFNFINISTYRSDCLVGRMFAR